MTILPHALHHVSLLVHLGSAPGQVWVRVLDTLIVLCPIPGEGEDTFESAVCVTTNCQKELGQMFSINAYIQSYLHTQVDMGSSQHLRDCPR